MASNPKTPSRREVIPALRRALDVNTSGRPAYIECVCHQYPVYGQWVGRKRGVKLCRS